MATRRRGNSRSAAETPARPRIGLALGSGSARGLAHIGVLRGLAALGIEPDVVAGTSIGALVGAAWAAGRLDQIQQWAVGVTKLEVLRFANPGAGRGGFLGGPRILDAIARTIGEIAIEDLARPYGCVATDFDTGREIWFTQGPLQEAVRASISMPGLFAPVQIGGRWLVDGALVNPVPVSVCRALGADVVVAVNLSGDLEGRNRLLRATALETPSVDEVLARLPDRLRARLEAPARALFASRDRERDQRKPPGFFDSIAGALNVMQDRITRSRMGGDPPDLLLEPGLAGIRLLDFDRAAAAIEAGMLEVEAHQSEILTLAGLREPPRRSRSETPRRRSVVPRGTS